MFEKACKTHIVSVTIQKNGSKNVRGKVEAGNLVASVVEVEVSDGDM